MEKNSDQSSRNSAKKFAKNHDENFAKSARKNHILPKSFLVGLAFLIAIFALENLIALIILATKIGDFANVSSGIGNLIGESFAKFGIFATFFVLFEVAIFAIFGSAVGGAMIFINIILPVIFANFCAAIVVGFIYFFAKKRKKTLKIKSEQSRGKYKNFAKIKGGNK